MVKLLFKRVYSMFDFIMFITLVIIGVKVSFWFVLLGFPIGMISKYYQDKFEKYIN